MSRGKHVRWLHGFNYHQFEWVPMTGIDLKIYLELGKAITRETYRRSEALLRFELADTRDRYQTTQWLWPYPEYEECGITPSVADVVKRRIERAVREGGTSNTYATY